MRGEGTGHAPRRSEGAGRLTHQKWDRLTPGTIPRRTQDGVTERPGIGTIKSVDGSQATFTMVEVPGYTFGPCPYVVQVTEDAACSVTHHHEVKPHPGDSCLVVFAGADRVPVVVGWW